MSTTAGIPIRLLPTRLQVGLALIAASLGVLVSYPSAFFVCTGVMAAFGLALAGEFYVMAAAVILSGVSFNFLGGTENAIAGIGLDGIRLGLVLFGFSVALVRRPALAGPIKAQWLYLLFISYGAATLLWSPSFHEGIRLLVKLAYPIAVYLMALHAIQVRGEAATVRVVGGAIGAAAIVNATVAVLGLSPWAGEGYQWRFAGASHPNTIGVFCGVSGLILYAWRERVKTLWAVPLIVLSMVQLVATGSRTAIVACGLGLVVYELLMRRFLRLSLCLASGALLWLVIPTLGARTASDSIDVGMGPTVLGAGINLSGRLSLWTDAWASLLGDGVWVGRGLGATDLFFSTRYVHMHSVHNGYLLVLLDLGLVGVGLFSAYHGWRLALSVATAGRHRASAVWALNAGLVTAFLAATFVESTLAGFTFPTLLWLSFAWADSTRRVGG